MLRRELSADETKVIIERWFRWFTAARQRLERLFAWQKEHPILILRYNSTSSRHSNTSASLTAFFRSCSDPKYRPVVRIDSCSSRN